MTKEERFRVTVRSYARQLIESGADRMQGYIIDDISRRTEKTFLNRYIKELSRDIPTYKDLGISSEQRILLLEKALQVCNDRLEVLNK